jgi:Glycosyltransferase 61
MKKPLGFFLRQRKNIVKTIEISDTVKYDRLRYYEGVYTIRNIVPETSDDLFAFLDNVNMIPGYIDSNSTKALSILGNNKKLIISMVNSFYHSLLDNISEIIYALESYPKHELVIDISEMKDALEHDPSQNFMYHNVFLYFLETLKMKKIKYRIVSLKKYDIIYINNFRVVGYELESVRKASLVYDFFKERVSNPKAKPTRKVFISRALTTGRQYDAPTLSCSNDNRIDNHQKLDALFESMGYEIVTTEKLDSFQEQLDLFYETKVVASITGSGLANAAFMQPGQTLIEIITPLVVPVGEPGHAKDTTNPYYTQELHNFYKNLAFYKDHTYFGIHNESRSFELLEKTIQNDHKIKNFLDRSDE